MDQPGLGGICATAGVRNHSCKVINPKPSNTEMEKAADAADMSVLFFLAGANL